MISGYTIKRSLKEKQYQKLFKNIKNNKNESLDLSLNEN